MEDKSIHAEYQLIAGNPDVIVFVHGILGSPAQFRFLADKLHPLGFDCMALLLPGHGGTAKAFSRVSSKAWQSYVDQYIEQLQQKYNRVFIIGHSLGGLLSLHYAAHHEIDGIVLLNTPLFFKLSIKQPLFSLKILFSDPAGDDAFMKAYRLAFSIQPGKIYEYPLWIRQFVRLYFIARETKRLLVDVKAPVLIIQSGRDESVSQKSAAILNTRLPGAEQRVVALPESYHGYFDNRDIKILI